MSCKNAVESGQQSSLQKLGPVRSQILRRDRQGPIAKIITTLAPAPQLALVYKESLFRFCAETILWIAGGWSFPAYSRRRAGCAVTIEQRNRGLLPYRPMGTFFVVVPTPILHLFLGIRKA